MGVGGKFTIDEFPIFNHEDGDEINEKQLKLLKRKVDARLKKLKLDTTWNISDGTISLAFERYKGVPEQIIPNFLVIWDVAKSIDCYIWDFTIPFTFEQDAGVFRFDGEILSVYHISVSGNLPNVTHYNLKDLEHLDIVYDKNGNARKEPILL